VVALRLAQHVVHFFPGQQEHLPPVARPVEALQAFRPHVVIGDDDKVQAGAGGGSGDCRMGQRPVGIDGVQVQIADSFVHGPSFRVIGGAHPL